MAPVLGQKTHEGAPAKRITPEQQLRRSVCSCLLWEKGFYEDGQEIASRIAEEVQAVSPSFVMNLAKEARTRFKLRHVPLLLVRELARKQSTAISGLLPEIIQRPDELTEFLAIYWKDGRCPLSAQVKKGLARAFTNFNAYQLAKYNQDKAIKLRDVLFLTHAKPKDEQQAEVWKRLVDGTLETPDTWEVSLSGGKDKKETWERLLSEEKLGTLALLRNLRNMANVGVNESLIGRALSTMKTERILPFRFIAAARHAPRWEPQLEQAMLKCLGNEKKFTGSTTVLVDVSGSMDVPVSSKSDMNRIDAACGIAILAREMYEDVQVFTFSESLVQVPVRRGFALRDAIMSSQPHASTYLGKAVSALAGHYERLIVFTDEQSHDAVSNPRGSGYMINVASNRNGVGYGHWIHVDGFSEATLDWIREYEAG